MDRESILAFLKENLRPGRYKHALGVEGSARELALRFGLDENKAALAGLTHDCAKSLPAEEQIRLARQTPFPVEEALATAPNTLHAPAGMVVARDVLGIEDEEVLRAICWHAVPCFNMGGLEMAVSLADYIEPRRHFAGVDDLRAYAKKSLEYAYFRALGTTFSHLAQQGRPLNPTTLREYNRLAEKINFNA